MTHGFDCKYPQQGAGYYTSEKYTLAQVEAVIMDMYQELPWLPYCINLNKEILAVKSEIEFHHADLISELTESEEHLENLNKYYDSIGASDKKISKEE